MIATKLQVFKRNAIIYAAAAVSDFFIPPNQLVRFLFLFIFRFFIVTFNNYFHF